eukprot:COSAG03_NODE_25215_length_267_cov_0.607143_1_plen_49_part_01
MLHHVRTKIAAWCSKCTSARLQADVSDQNPQLLVLVAGHLASGLAESPA